jgi:hypothetical protein
MPNFSVIMTHVSRGFLVALVRTERIALSYNGWRPQLRDQPQDVGKRQREFSERRLRPSGKRHSAHADDLRAGLDQPFVSEQSLIGPGVARLGRKLPRL